jgi:hypothetical protein
MSENYEEFNASKYMTNEDATHSVNKFKDFRIHFTVFILINAFLLFLDLRSGTSLWFYWILIPWGFGVYMHFWTTFLENRIISEKRRDVWIHGAVTTGLTVMLLLFDFLPSPTLNWCYWPIGALLFAWIIHFVSDYPS